MKSPVLAKTSYIDLFVYEASMVMFNISVFDQKYPFQTNLVQKTKNQV